MVTVVIPAWNAARHIGRALASLRTSTFTDFAVIIADDGSTDRTVETATREGADLNVRVLSWAERTGAIAALNRAIRASAPARPYLALLGSDDWLTPDSLERRVVAIETCDLVCGRSFVVDERKRILRKQRSAFFGPTVLMRRDLFERFGLFDETLYYKGDREMWVRLFGADQTRTDRATFRMLPKTIGYWTKRADSMQHAFGRLPESEKEVWLERFERACERRRDNPTAGVELLARS